MQRMVNPRQTRLFDPYEPVLTRDEPPMAGGELARRVSPRHPGADAGRDACGSTSTRSWGRPSRELYSMAGLLLLLEFRNWTQEQAVEAYRFHTRGSVRPEPRTPGPRSVGPDLGTLSGVLLHRTDWLRG